MPKLRAILSAEEKTAPPAKPIGPTKPIEGTQAHEAEKFILANLDSLRCIEDRKQWVEWNGFYWGRESVGSNRAVQSGENNGVDPVPPVPDAADPYEAAGVDL